MSQELYSAPVLEHLDELRNRIIYSLIFLIIGIFIAFYFRLELFYILKAPLSASKQYQMGNVQFVSTKLMGQFMASLHISFWAGLMISLPFILWQAWLFVAPGLYDHEKKWALPFIIGASLAFVLGIIFSYYTILPSIVRFFLDFSDGLITPMQDVSEYITTVVGFLAAFGIAFEMPILIIILTKINILNYKLLREFYRYAVVFILVLSALITPTSDPTTMLIVALPLYILYEISTFFSWIFRNKDEYL